MQDLTLQILAVCGVVSLILGLTLDEHKEIGWIEGFAIIVAVIIVVLTTGTQDY